MQGLNKVVLRFKEAGFLLHVALLFNVITGKTPTPIDIRSGIFCAHKYISFIYFILFVRHLTFLTS